MKNFIRIWEKIEFSKDAGCTILWLGWEEGKLMFHPIHHQKPCHENIIKEQFNARAPLCFEEYAENTSNLFHLSVWTLQVRVGFLETPHYTTLWSRLQIKQSVPRRLEGGSVEPRFAANPDVATFKEMVLFRMLIILVLFVTAPKSVTLPIGNCQKGTMVPFWQLSFSFVRKRQPQKIIKLYQ